MKGRRGFSEPDMAYMQEHPNERANIIGRRVPYHLQYLQNGGVDVKPREEKEDENSTRNEI